MENNEKQSAKSAEKGLTGKQIEVLINSFTELYITYYGKDECIKRATECYCNYAELILHNSVKDCNAGFYVETLYLLRCVLEMFQNVHFA